MGKIELFTSSGTKKKMNEESPYCVKFDCTGPC